jgi:hypothetical protein
MAWMCRECNSTNVVETVVQNINTGVVEDGVDDSTRCNDCLSRDVAYTEDNIPEGHIKSSTIKYIWTSDGRNNDSVWCQTEDALIYKIKAKEITKLFLQADVLLEAKLARKHTYLTLA